MASVAKAGFLAARGFYPRSRSFRANSIIDCSERTTHSGDRLMVNSNDAQTWKKYEFLNNQLTYLWPATQNLDQLV